MSLTDKDLVAIGRLLERYEHRADKRMTSMQTSLEKGMAEMETRLGLHAHEQKQQLIKRIDELDYQLTLFIENMLKKLSSASKTRRGTLRA